MRKTFETLDEFMHAQIADRKQEARSGAPSRNDVLSLLVRANEDGGKYPLDDTELVSRSVAVGQDPVRIGEHD